MELVSRDRWCCVSQWPQASETAKRFVSAPALHLLRASRPFPRVIWVLWRRWIKQSLNFTLLWWRKERTWLITFAQRWLGSDMCHFCSYFSGKLWWLLVSVLCSGCVTPSERDCTGEQRAVHTASLHHLLVQCRGACCSSSKTPGPFQRLRGSLVSLFYGLMKNTKKKKDTTAQIFNCY